MASFAIDPNERDLPFVVDLDLAPRNAEGLVEFKAVLDIVKPVDLSRGNRRLLFDNRGNRGAFTRLNDGGGSDLSKESYAGNGFLNRLGYTVVWCGWQGDLVYTGNNLVAFVPEARQNDQPLRGKVRQEFIVDRRGVLSMPVSGAANIQCYPVLDRANATLTVREKEADPRVPLPGSEWELAKAKDTDGKVELAPSNTDLYVKGGFKPGWIYELIYDTEGSRVMGLGFLGLRDLVSFLRHGKADANGVLNPLAGFVDKAYGYGASLAGRVVREYVYEGWNRDAEETQSFDAVLTHTGVGRLFSTCASLRSDATRASMKSIPGPRSATPSTSLPCRIRFPESGQRAQAPGYRSIDHTQPYRRRILGAARLDDSYRPARWK